MSDEVPEPRYVWLYRVNYNRQPSYEEMCVEHEHLGQRAQDLFAQGLDSEKRGDSRTHLAALRSEYDALFADLKESKRYLEAYNERWAEQRGQYIKERDRRWRRMLIAAYGHAPS